MFPEDHPDCGEGLDEDSDNYTPPLTMCECSISTELPTLRLWEAGTDFYPHFAEEETEQKERR